MARSDNYVAIFTAFDGDTPWDPTVPEKNLLRALLVSAMSDIKKSGRARRQALEFFLDNSEDYIFSFHSVCEHLCIEPSSVLAAVGLDAEKIRQEHDNYAA